MTAPAFERSVSIVEYGGHLSEDQSCAAIEAIVSGSLDDASIERFLRAMMAKGESVDELVGGARAMRRHVTPIECRHADAIDTCGTGGDGISTFNVSTAAAIVAAAAGAKVAKHGNRTNSRKSGSAEALSALGVNIDAPPDVVARCLNEIGIGFLFAAKLHPAMGRVVHIRRAIGRPTIFNLLGPLTNPAGVKRQIIGVPRPGLIPKIAAALQRLGATHAIVVHGSDGLCDFTITGASRFAELRDGRIEEREIEPATAGLGTQGMEGLRVDSPSASAEMIRLVLSGENGAARDHTLLNAAAALVVANVSGDMADGVLRASAAIDSGAARDVLGRLVQWTN